MKNKSGFLNKVYTLVMRHVTSFVMFLLPSNVIYIYLEVILSTFFVKSRSKDVDVDMVRFFDLVNNDYNRNVTDLPNYTLSILWNQDLLDSKHEFMSGKHTITQVMEDRELLKYNMDRLVDILVSNLPLLMRIKLGAVGEKSRRALRESIVKLMNRRFSDQVV